MLGKCIQLLASQSYFTAYFTCNWAKNNIDLMIPVVGVILVADVDTLEQRADLVHQQIHLHDQAFDGPNSKTTQVYSLLMDGQWPRTCTRLKGTK